MTVTVAARIAAASASLETNQRAGEFLQIAKALCASRNDAEAARILAKAPIRDSVREAFETRAATPAGVTYDSTWAGVLTPYTQLSDAFGESLRNISAFDRILGDGSFLRVPPQTQVAITTALMTAYQVNESAPKPATVSGFTSVQLSMVKCSAFCVISAELMRAGGTGAINLLRRELSGAVGLTTDTYFISQLTTGLTAIPSPGVPSAITVREDLRYLMDAVSFGSNARLYYIAPPALAKRLAVLGDSAGGKAFPGVTPMGGTLDGIPLLVSDVATAQTLILLDAAQVAVAAGVVELDRSNVATLQLDSAPDSPPLVSSNYQPLWQLDQSALRAERFLSVARLRTTAVASVSGITGIGNSPS
jgi:HK97 family phage major capsid protein